jgi:hypothetical protein
VEDDGVLDPADSLDDQDLNSDVLDRGIDAGDRYRGVNRFGTTPAEERQGESLDERLSEEEPDITADEERGGAAEDGGDDEDSPSDLGTESAPRAGRLVAPDEGAHEDEEKDSVAADVGIDGAGAGAEEAAVHVIEE